MVICKSCGAKIDEKAVECPFCHALQMDAAEAKYMDNLYKMHGRMDQLDDNAKGYVVKRTFVHVAVTAGCIILAVLIGFITGYNSDRRNNYYGDSDEIEEELDWYDTNIPLLNTYYEQGEYEKIYDAMEKTGTYTNNALKKWTHYGVVRIYIDYYQYALDAIETFDQGKELSKYDIKDVYNDALELKELMENRTSHSSSRYYADASEEEKLLVQQWRKREEDFLLKVGITQEELDRDYNELYIENDSTDTYKLTWEKVEAYYAR